MSEAHLNKLLEENNVRYVDLRFTDSKGKENHVTIPAKLVDAEMLSEGKMFDGSSIEGWKGIAFPERRGSRGLPSGCQRRHGQLRDIRRSERGGGARTLDALSADRLAGVPRCSRHGGETTRRPLVEGRTHRARVELSGF